MLKKARNSHKSKVEGRKSSCTQSDVPNGAQQKSGTKSPRAISPRFLISFLILNFSLFTLSSCGFDVEDPTPPDPPQWVPKSLPEEWPETGIDATESGAVTLNWHVALNLGISQLYIFRRDNSSQENATIIANINGEQFQTGEYQDEEVDVNIRYYYYLLAEDAAGNISTPSDTINYQLLSEIQSEHMIPGDDQVFDQINDRFSWVYSYTVPMELYGMVILHESGELVYQKTFQPGNYTGSREYHTIPTSVELEPGERYKWRIDVFADFKQGKELTGSESSWSTFVAK